MPTSTGIFNPESAISVSPLHHIELPEALRLMVEQPPDHDYTLRTLSQKTVNDQPLIQGELVIAGADTREEFPLAATYPVHFRKTYYPICFHQDPAREFENHSAVSESIDVPPPIGCTRTTFRSCFIPGRAYSALSPFGADPEDGNIRIAREADPAALIGLWKILENIHGQVTRLHEAGIAHGDLFLHNVIVSFRPVGAHLIDFEQAVLRDRDYGEDGKPNTPPWDKVVEADLRELLREAVFAQCSLGPQPCPLGEASLSRLPSLVADPGRFERALADASSHER